MCHATSDSVLFFFFCASVCDYVLGPAGRRLIITQEAVCVCGSLSRGDSHRAQRVCTLVCFWGCTRDSASCSILSLGPLNPTQRSPLADPSFPQRSALHLIRATLAKCSAELLTGPSELVPMNNAPSFASTLTLFACENT